MTPKKLHRIEEKITVDAAFALLTSSIPELKEKWDKYVEEEYSGKDYQSERFDYLDIAEISRYIVEKAKSDQTQDFPKFFDTVEIILNNCDGETDNLIVVGLIEGIQNIGGKSIDYYFGFNKWLGQTTKKIWDGLIDAWEGKEWRQRKRPLT